MRAKILPSTGRTTTNNLIQPFVQECVKARQFQEASKYIIKCEPAIRPMLFVKIGAFREAAEQAFTNKDMATLRFVLQ
jgi:hypothetical protein